MGDQRHGLVGAAAAHSSHWAASRRGQLTHHRQGFRSVSANGVATQGAAKQIRWAGPPPHADRCAGHRMAARSAHPAMRRPWSTGAAFTEPTSVITAPFGKSRDQLGGRIPAADSMQSQPPPGPQPASTLDRCPPGLPGPVWLARSAVAWRMHPGPHLQASARRSKPIEAHRSRPVRLSPPVSRHQGCLTRNGPPSAQLLRFGDVEAQAHHQLKQLLRLGGEAAAPFTSPLCRLGAAQPAPPAITP